MKLCFAVLGDIHMRSHGCEQFQCYLLIQLVVLDEQQPRPAQTLDVDQLRSRWRPNRGVGSSLRAERLARCVEEQGRADPA